MSNPSDTNKDNSKSNALTTIFIATISCSLALIYLKSVALHGWIPWDDGTVAQVTNRLQNGELVHIDFIGTHTGGLAYYHALVFDIFGTNLASLRWALLIAAGCVLPFQFFIAKTNSKPFTTLVVFSSSVFLSIPTHFASLPSWYNTFCALIGTAFLLRYLTCKSSWLLMIAGVFAGASILAKVSGLFFVAAILLLFVYLEQDEQLTADSSVGNTGSLTYPCFVIISLLLFILVLLATIAPGGGPTGIFHFVFPPATLIGVLLFREFQLIRRGTNSKDRFRSLMCKIAPFTFGLLLPIAVFCLPYISRNGLAQLIEGVFITPQQRFDHASAFRFTNQYFLLCALPWATLLLAWRVCHKLLFRFIVLILLFGMLIILPFFQYKFIFPILHSIFILPICISLASAMVLIKSNADIHEMKFERSSLFLLSIVTVLVSLIRFPYINGLYLLYIAMFFPLCLKVFFPFLQTYMQRFALSAIAAFGLFMLLYFNSHGYLKGMWYAQSISQLRPLELERGGILIHETEAELYAKLVESIKKHSSSPFIIAAPDCPEVYFLSGYRSPIGAIFEFFISEEMDDSIADIVEKHSISVAVINHKAQFSKNLVGKIEESVSKIFPKSEQIGHFEVRWR